MEDALKAIENHLGTIFVLGFWLFVAIGSIVSRARE